MEVEKENGSNKNLTEVAKENSNTNNNNNIETNFNSLNLKGQKVELNLDIDIDIEKNSKENNNKNKKNTKCVIIMGMAGSGKTTFVERLEKEFISRDYSNYLINLDPAVHDCLYEPNMDIRDTVNYKQVMSTHNLGPNGAIMTSLNIFSTSMHKVVEVLEKQQQENSDDTNNNNLDFVVVDTPGQLEVFSWSASGKLISDSLALVYPSATVILYVLDLARNQNPNTFVSNMLYALSIMYKMQLPLVLVLNKKDVVNQDMCISWIKDYNELQAALDSSSDYISTFSNSLCLTLEEFYKTIDYVSVSSKTGDGFDDLFSVLFKLESNYSQEKEKCK
jgi:GTPase SAR1 family protein